MTDLSLTKLKPLIANENCFSRSDVARAIKLLWITREDEHALKIADDLIRLERFAAVIDFSNGRRDRYRFTGNRCQCCGSFPE